jgi:hypothetical protein
MIPNTSETSLSDVEKKGNFGIPKFELKYELKECRVKRDTRKSLKR